jgi:hypothetical protein
LGKAESINYEKFCDEVFKLDKKIRYVGIFNKKDTYFKMRQGVKNLLTPNQTIWSLKDAFSRWKTREALSDKLGKPMYAMAEYEKVKRVTIPFGNDGLILVSMEPTLYHEIVTKEILDLRDRYLLDTL